jgi:hypothetical protein
LRLAVFDISTRIGMNHKCKRKSSGGSAVEQTDLLKLAIQVLDQLGIRYAIIGSFASGVWGESRFTQDIDFLIELSPAQVSLLCTSFPEAEFYVSETAARSAVADSSQFNVIHPASGNKIDFMIAGRTAWAAEQLARRRRVLVLPNQKAEVAAPEDVILGKLVYYREGGSEKHIRDITGILAISGDLVDRDYVAKHAAALGVQAIWQAIVDRVDEGATDN